MALTIKQILDSLKDDERRLLNYAFEHEMTEYIRLKDSSGKPNGCYVGVNAGRSPSLIPEQIAGAWSIGWIKG